MGKIYTSLGKKWKRWGRWESKNDSERFRKIVKN